MHKHTLIKQLHELHNAEKLIIREIKSYLTEYISSNREFKDGEIVEVWHKYKNEPLGFGIITEAFILVTDHLYNWASIRIYAEQPEEWTKSISEIVYRVVDIKRDGTPSLKRKLSRYYFSSNDKDDFYIKKIDSK